MGLLSRRKGVAFELGVSRVLRTIWPKSKRGIGQARMAGECPDVDGTPYWVETKHMKKVCIRAAYEQGQDASDGRPVVVVSRENRGPILVTMALPDWLHLVKPEGTP